ncbi:hypothetical protein SS1G_04424 [Sclerotinia sclerotiorum 1980 UF-70]|uniref:Uncharacterized protein n=1 Tax=Sclerotinia sclerotiorum (strain ATCC 18683 / 1980 / Ss-1) TaxID=665079 RepID=A7EGI3_SCLS1|nr:hypothetical protein SS1G_04424 [Sclerotinia sclerotiorum 1980 UF-70]EDO01949.1 hypothetical protein SS1G_04424 [Sclerotinia sclerotiorum 1980 UF-70]
MSPTATSLNNEPAIIIEFADRGFDEVVAGHMNSTEDSIDIQDS